MHSSHAGCCKVDELAKLDKTLYRLYTSIISTILSPSPSQLLIWISILFMGLKFYKGDIRLLRSQILNFLAPETKIEKKGKRIHNVGFYCLMCICRGSRFSKM